MGTDQRGYEDLVGWRKALDLAEVVYRLVALLPREERFELSPQLRRAVVSIASNIAEGASRLGTAEFLYHLGVSRGSLAEVDTLVEIGARVGCLPRPDVNRVRAMIEEERRILCGLITSLHRRTARQVGARRTQSLPQPSPARTSSLPHSPSSDNPH
ncbi:MAG: four helix bundle protein [Planctomycetes bacterium]|nr:four helix bundle protein [Planctomycetota bacterium]